MVRSLAYRTFQRWAGRTASMSARAPSRVARMACTRRRAENLPRRMHSASDCDRKSSVWTVDHPSNFGRLVLGCINADFRVQIRVVKRLTRSTWRPCISKMDGRKDGTHRKRKGKKRSTNSTFFWRPKFSKFHKNINFYCQFFCIFF